MKANDFIKKFGIDLAKRDIAALEAGFIKRKDIYEHYGFDIIDDLKRLIKSHELVESWGSIEDAKVASKSGRHYKYLKQAIADVESCQ